MQALPHATRPRTEYWVHAITNRVCKARLLVLCALVSGCGIYRPNVVNVPLLEQRGDLKLSGHLAINGLNAQASYAPLKHVGLLANLQHKGLTRKDHSSANFETHQHRFKEVGAGLFSVRPDSVSWPRREVFFLVGQGSSNRFVQGLDTARNVLQTTVNATYYRYCLQADFGQANRRTSVALSPRIFLIHYRRTDIRDNRFGTVGDTTYSRRADFVYAEVAATAWLHLGRYVSVMGQGVVTAPVASFSEQKVAFIDDFAPLSISLGLVINLGLFRGKE